MTCNYCLREFEPLHFNQRLCSPDCKQAAIRRAKNAYKATEKGVLANSRWVNTERRKENEKRYAAGPRRRKLQVMATARYLINHPEAQEKKRELDRRYAKSEIGRAANRRAVAAYKSTEHGKQVRRISRAMRRGAAGRFTPTAWAEKLIEHGNRCAHCGAGGRLEIDHIKPIKLGGTNMIDNVQPLCRSCNSSKGARHVG